MSRFNLIAGAFFGLSAVLGSAWLDSHVKSQLDHELAEKAKPIPAVHSPEGIVIRDATSEISILDRRESDERWSQYLNGYRYLMVNGLALVALGLVGGLPNVNRLIPAIGGGSFVVGTTLYAVGMIASILLSMPILTSFSPIGGILLGGGWGCLMIAGYQAKR